MKKILIYAVVLTFLTGCYKTESNVSTIDSSDSLVPSLDSATVVYDVDSSLFDSETVNGDINYNAADSIKIGLITYDDAVAVNTSEGWRKFLKDNPGYKNKEEINEKIIRAEVNEITNDKNTGEMPSAEKIGNTKTSKSKVIIENDTSCDLTIRYSGPDAKRITIAPNSKGTVDLGSGNYTVAASACGYNYAGSEALSGNYSVVYYISTVRY